MVCIWGVERGLIVGALLSGANFCKCIISVDFISVLSMKPCWEEVSSGV